MRWRQGLVAGLAALVPCLVAVPVTADSTTAVPRTRLGGEFFGDYAHVIQGCRTAARSRSAVST